MDLTIGRQFGPYTVLDLIGKGTVSNVYEVTTRSGAHRALKVLTPLAMGSAEVREGFEREYRLMRRLGNPNVPAVHWFGEFAGVLVLEMELLRADTLKDRLPPEQAIPEIDVCALGVSVARTLAGIHEARVVHRDVKPSNILLPPGRPPVVFDFGLAVDLDHPDIEPGRVYGSPTYLAPEQALGLTTIDGRADLYALGMTLYRAAAGRMPMYGSRAETLEWHVSGVPDPPSTHAKLTPELDAVILRALEKDPDDRFPDGLALAEALEAVPAPDPEPHKPGFFSRVFGRGEARPRLVDRDAEIGR